MIITKQQRKEERKKERERERRELSTHLGPILIPWFMKEPPHLLLLEVVDEST